MSNQLTDSQVFPIYNSLIARTPEALKSSAKPFDIDNVAAYWIHHDKWNFDMRSDFGPIRLPFPVVWMEHAKHVNAPQKSGVPANGWMLMEFQSGDETRAKLLKHYGGKDERPDEILIVASLFWGTNHADGCAVLTWVTEEGKWITSMCHFPPNSPLLHAFMKGGHSAQESASELRAMFNPVALAIGLANCKNIDVDTKGTRGKLRKKGRRKLREPGTEYKVIRLPGAPSNRIDGRVEASETARLHQVRGHFKTYTSERPLYGRLTGTWWWSPAIRGKKKNGEIVTSYKQEVHK